MAKVFLRELQNQLDLVNQKVRAIHIPRGPVAHPVPKEVLERREKLLKRRAELEDLIINYRHE